MKGITVAVRRASMKTSAFLCSAFILAGCAGRAVAGEDSTDRWHRVGPAFYEVKGGLKRFAAGDPSEPPLTRTRESKEVRRR